MKTMVDLWIRRNPFSRGTQYYFPTHYSTERRIFGIEGAGDLTGAFFQERPLLQCSVRGKRRGIIPTSLPLLWVWERELGEALNRVAAPSGGLSFIWAVLNVMASEADLTVMWGWCYDGSFNSKEGSGEERDLHSQPEGWEICSIHSSDAQGWCPASI